MTAVTTAAPPLPFRGGMSPIGHALHCRFDQVCRSELQRLRRKTASLSPEDRAEVDAITVEVTRAIASRMDAAVCAGGTDVAAVVARLFAVPGEERS